VWQKVMRYSEIPAYTERGRHKGAEFRLAQNHPELSEVRDRMNKHQGCSWQPDGSFVTDKS